MTVTFGTVSREPMSAPEVERAQRGAARRRGGPPPAADSAPGWFVARPQEGADQHFARDGDSFALVAGRPRAHGSEKAVAEHGLAAFCLREYARQGTSFLRQLHGPFARCTRALLGARCCGGSAQVASL
jgi:hypothetical protein